MIDLSQHPLETVIFFCLCACVWDATGPGSDSRAGVRSCRQPNLADTAPSSPVPIGPLNVVVQRCGGCLLPMGNVLSRNDTPAHNIAKAAAGWLAVFLASTAVLRGQRGFGLHEGVTPMQAASRVASFFHGTITTAAALPSCLGKSLEQIRLDTDAYNTDTENRILEFSIGYFLVDTVWLLKYDPDPTFLIHHFVTIVTWLSSRYLGNKRGQCWLLLPCQLRAPLACLTRAGCCAAGQAAIGPMLGLAYAEMTAPLQVSFC